MAKLRSVIGSGFVGRIGNVVGVRGKGGEYVIRARAEEVKNPNTKRQQVSRSKMSMASKAAALLATAIEIGYAKAAAGTKMYPRNMFVKNLIPVDGGYFNVNDGVVTMVTNNLPVSQKMGIEVTPYIVKTSGDAGSIILAATNIGQVPLNTGEKVAFIAVGYTETLGAAVVKQVVKAASGDTTITFTREEMGEADFDSFVGFYKIIPPAKNGVATEEIPWKYPSATSKSTPAVA